MDLKKLSSGLYGVTRKLGKLASTANDLEHIAKTVKTGDPSHIMKRMARKKTGQMTHKGAHNITKEINKLFK